MAAEQTEPSPVSALEPPAVITSKNSNNPQISDDDIKRAAEATSNNKFAFCPAVLDKLMQPKDLQLFYHLGGLRGLELGLRTDISAGLDMDESVLDGAFTFGQVRDALLSGINSPPNHTSTGPHTKTLALLSSRGETHKPFEDRRHVFGNNRIPESVPQTFLQLIWAAYNDKVLFLLTAAAAISLSIGIYQTIALPIARNAPIEWVEGVAILVAIVIIVLVSAINDYQKERQFLALKEKMKSRHIKVIRSGKSQEISIFHLLVGDVVLLEPGDVIPADGIFTKGHLVKCDESSLTGETKSILKHPGEDVYNALQTLDLADEKNLQHHDPFILSGSKVVEGVGSYLVTATGVNSVHGKIVASLKDESGPTPLQVRLDHLAQIIAKTGTAVAVIMFVIMFVEFCVRLRHSSDSPTQKGQLFLNVLIIALTVLVIAVPEGLPLAVTLTLAFATTRMVKDNNLVRQLQSCETMGNATAVCSDKTGTLTQNKMHVFAGTIGLYLRFSSKNGEASSPASPEVNPEVEKPPRNDVKDIHLSDLKNILFESSKTLLVQSIAINSTAFEDKGQGNKGFIGSRTEIALLLLAQDQLGMQDVGIERANAAVVQLYPFNASRKSMATVIKLADDRYRLLVKGAPELLLEKSTRIVEDPTTGISDTALTTKDEASLRDILHEFALHSFRPFGLFYRDFSQWPPLIAQMDDDGNVGLDGVMEDLVVLALFGIQDPVRPDVLGSVRDCQRAGIVVRMVTGDNIVTAKAVARQCGILTDGTTMDGKTFRNLSETEMEEVIPNLQVLARAIPEDKRTLVQQLRKCGEIVAVTGDGTNDAPALAAADIGFSMGLTGTEVAKEASSIILMDDNFSSIVKAIVWGRAVNDAVKKFLQFQITVSITSVTLTFVSAITNSNEQSVLTPVQLMWVNLIQDTLAALALATDAPSRTILDRKPEPRSASLITGIMWKNIVGQSIYQLAVTITLHYASDRIFSYTAPDAQARGQTAVFNTYVWLQIFNQWSCRRIDNEQNIFEGMHRNWFFICINVIMVVIQLIVMFLGGDAFSITKLNGVQWAYSVVLGAISIPVGFLIRLLPVEGYFERWRPKLRWPWSQGNAEPEIP